MCGIEEEKKFKYNTDTRRRSFIFKAQKKPILLKLNENIFFTSSLDNTNKV